MRKISAYFAVVLLACGCARKLADTPPPKPDDRRIERVVSVINSFVQQSGWDDALKIASGDVSKYYWTRHDIRMPSGVEYHNWASTIDHKWSLIVDDGSKIVVAVSPGISPPDNKELLAYSLRIDTDSGSIVQVAKGPTLIDR